MGTACWKTRSITGPAMRPWSDEFTGWVTARRNGYTQTAPDGTSCVPSGWASDDICDEVLNCPETGFDDGACLPLPSVGNTVMLTTRGGRRGNGQAITAPVSVWSHAGIWRRPRRAATRAPRKPPSSPVTVRLRLRWLLRIANKCATSAPTTDNMNRPRPLHRG